MDTFPLHAKLTIDVECIPLLVAGEREPTDKGHLGWYV